MGAWGEKAFQNDSALDWLAELDAGGMAALRSILSKVADTGEDSYLDVDDGTSAIAAAEIVAAALGGGRDRVPENVLPWLDANTAAVGANDLALARRAVDRILAGSSELCELWDENGADTAWHANVRALLVRLGRDVGTVA